MMLGALADGPARSKAAFERRLRTPLLALLVGVAVLGAGCGSGSSTDTSGSSSAVSTLLKEGINEANTNRLGQATTAFEDALRVSPNNTYALYDLGVIDQKRHDTAGALSYYDRAISADGSYTPAMYNKAILLEGGDPGAALGIYKRIVKLNPNASTAYLRMAFIYAGQGKRTLAKEARATAIALEPRLARYHLP
jgi:tetratricopeptide (TPR) repeat protein